MEMSVRLNAKYLEPFVNSGELEAILPQVQAVRDALDSDALSDGWIFRSIMTGTNLQGFSRRHRKSAVILRFW